MGDPDVTDAGSGRDGSWRIAANVGAAGGGVGATGPIDLVVRDGIIASMRAATDVSIEGPWLVLVPLLVNGHDHGRGRGNVLAGIADAPLEPWIESLRDPRFTSTQADLVGDGCRLMLASGVGGAVICVNPQHPDTAAEVLAAAEAAIAVGVRAAIAFPFADAMGVLDGRSLDEPGWTAEEVRARIDSFEKVAVAIDDERIELQLGPVGPQWVSESTLLAIGIHAKETGRRVHMHLLESKAQRRWADRVYPDGIVALLDRVGLLGPHMCFAHGTNLRPDEIDALAGAGAVLSLNVSSNLRLASGIPPVAAAERAEPAGLGMAAGLDGMALGDDADYWTELRLLRGVLQAQTGRAANADLLFEQVLVGGRRALGGCAPLALAVGAPADFVLLDLSDHRHLADEFDWSPASIALAAGRPERIREVWVAGRRVFCGPAMRTGAAR